MGQTAVPGAGKCCGVMTDTEVGVLLVDDQELVRTGLRRILRRKDGFAIVGSAPMGARSPLR